MKNLSPIFFLFVVFGMSCKKDVTVHFHNTTDYTLKNFTVDSVSLGDIKPHKTSKAYYCEQVTCNCRIPNLHLTCLIDTQFVSSYLPPHSVIDDCYGSCGGKAFGLVCFNVSAYELGTDTASLQATAK